MPELLCSYYLSPNTSLYILHVYCAVAFTCIFIAGTVLRTEFIALLRVNVRESRYETRGGILSRALVLNNSRGRCFMSYSLRSRIVYQRGSYDQEKHASSTAGIFIYRFYQVSFSISVGQKVFRVPNFRRSREDSPRL